MIRRLVAVVSCLAAFAVVAASGVASARTIPGTQAWRVNGATRLGPQGARRMTITLALAPRNATALSRAAKSRPKLSPAEWNARFAPSKATVMAIRKWAAKHKLHVASVSADRMLVRLTGASTAIGRAFGTSFARYTSPKTGHFFQITRSAVVPRAFAGSVSSVMGLSSLGRVRLSDLPTLPTVSLPPVDLPSTAAAQKTLSSVGTAASGLSYPADYGPQQFWAMYDAPSSQTGSGQTLAIITEGDVSQPKQDLATFESKFGLPTVTWNQINVGTPSSDTSGDDEWDLDSQYSTGFAPGVTTLDDYNGPSLNDQDIVNTIDRWVTDNTAKQGSFSAGECEVLAYVSGMTASLDPILEKATAQGQTMFFSSGDTGAFCPAVVGVNGVPAGIPNVNYPASSPYGIGVGGTTVLSPTGPTEIAWYAGGGGPSWLEPTPAWQTGLAGVAPLPTRGVPDVSLDADPGSGYDVIVGGTEEVIGGTSASAPSWQGIWARAQGAHGGSLGFAGPILYHTEPATAYHDIVAGANGFPATPGWDFATGLGTPDITALVAGA